MQQYLSSARTRQLSVQRQPGHYLVNRYTRAVVAGPAPLPALRAKLRQRTAKMSLRRGQRSPLAIVQWGGGGRAAEVRASISAARPFTSWVGKRVVARGKHGVVVSHEMTETPPYVEVMEVKTDDGRVEGMPAASVVLETTYDRLKVKKMSSRTRIAASDFATTTVFTFTDQAKGAQFARALEREFGRVIDAQTSGDGTVRVHWTKDDTDLKTLVSRAKTFDGAVKMSRVVSASDTDYSGLTAQDKQRLIRELEQTIGEARMLGNTSEVRELEQAMKRLRAARVVSAATIKKQPRPGTIVNEASGKSWFLAEWRGDKAHLLGQDDATRDVTAQDLMKSYSWRGKKAAMSRTHIAASLSERPMIGDRIKTTTGQIITILNNTAWPAYAEAVDHTHRPIKKFQVKPADLVEIVGRGVVRGPDDTTGEAQGPRLGAKYMKEKKEYQHRPFKKASLMASQGLTRRAVRASRWPYHDLAAWKRDAIHVGSRVQKYGRVPDSFEVLDHNGTLMGRFGNGQGYIDYSEDPSKMKRTTPEERQRAMKGLKEKFGMSRSVRAARDPGPQLEAAGWIQKSDYSTGARTWEHPRGAFLKESLQQPGTFHYAPGRGQPQRMFVPLSFVLKWGGGPIGASRDVSAVLSRSVRAGMQGVTHKRLSSFEDLSVGDAIKPQDLTKRGFKLGRSPTSGHQEFYKKTPTGSVTVWFKKGKITDIVSNTGDTVSAANDLVSMRYVFPSPADAAAFAAACKAMGLKAKASGVAAAVSKPGLHAADVSDAAREHSGKPAPKLEGEAGMSRAVRAAEQAQQRVRAGVGQQFNDEDSWRQEAKRRGFKVIESTHPSGVGTWLKAKDRDGNHVGDFDLDDENKRPRGTLTQDPRARGMSRTVSAAKRLAELVHAPWDDQESQDEFDRLMKREYPAIYSKTGSKLGHLVSALLGADERGARNAASRYRLDEDETVTLWQDLKMSRVVSAGVVYDVARAKRELDKMMFNSTKEIYGTGKQLGPGESLTAVKVKKFKGADGQPEFSVAGKPAAGIDAAAQQLVDAWSATNILVADAARRASVSAGAQVKFLAPDRVAARKLAKACLEAGLNSVRYDGDTGIMVPNKNVNSLKRVAGQAGVEVTQEGAGDVSASAISSAQANILEKMATDAAGGESDTDAGMLRDFLKLVSGNASVKSISQGELKKFFLAYLEDNSSDWE